MTDYSTMGVSDLLFASKEHLETENELTRLLMRAADLALDSNAALAMLFRVLAEEPSEVAAMRAEEMRELSQRLHADSDGPDLCRAASNALAQFEL